RPDVQRRARSQGARAARLDVRLGDDDSGHRARLPLRHRAARARSDPDGDDAFMSLFTTSSQTVGPYVRIGLESSSIQELAPPGVAGERIVLAGRVLDGDGKPVNDGVVEIWQANALGKYAHPEDAQDKSIDAHFRGFGRCLTDTDGGFRFAT